jgi:hypothetical protein
MPVILTTACLDEFLGKSIVDICPAGFGKIGDNDNHCAHFVGHVLRINDIGYTCTQHHNPKKKPASQGAVLRVNELYNACEKIAQPEVTGCLAYFTLPGNLTGNQMGSMSKKHVGIWFAELVWNYGNTADKVRKDTVEWLSSYLGGVYGGKIAVRYTKFPPNATFQTLAQIKGKK